MRQDSIFSRSDSEEKNSFSGLEVKEKTPVLLLLVSIVIALLFAVPFLYLAVRNIVNINDLTNIFFSKLTFYPLIKTLYLAFTVSIAASFIGVLLAWITIRTDVHWGSLWRILCPLPLVFPSFVVGTTLISAYSPGGFFEFVFLSVGIEQFPRLDGYIGSFLVLTFITFPYVYLPVAARFSTLPSSTEEAARLLGYNSFATFKRVTLPQIFPTIRAGTLLIFLYVVSDFGVVQLMGYSTLTTRIFNTRLADTELSLALGLVLGLVALLIVLGERFSSKELNLVNDNPSIRPTKLKLGRWQPMALFTIVITLGAGLFSPIIILFWWAYRGFINQTAGFATTSDLMTLALPTVNTVVMSVSAALTTVLLVLPIAFLVTRFRSILITPINAIIVSGFALPGLVVALSIVFLSINVTGFYFLYQTLPILLLAYIIHFGAQAYRTAQVGVLNLDNRLSEVARTLGTGRLLLLVKIELPQMLPALAAGGGLVMLSTMKELPATLLASPIGFKTLATHIWALNEAGFLADAGVASLLLVILSAVLTWLVVIRNAIHLR